jgi:hypothetical protein
VAVNAQLRVILGVALVITSGLGATCVACGDTTSSTNLVHSEHVSKATFKGKWPVTADGGTLACDGTKGGAITFSPDGSADVYAENGIAMNQESKEGWKDFREIWLPAGPDDLGPNVNATDFDNEGHKLCAMNGK